MSLPPLQPEQRVKPRYFEFRISLIFAAIFFPLGVHLPYFPLWLENKGFDAEQIGILLAAPMFLRVVTTPMITALADRASDRVNVLIALAAAAFVLSLGYFLPATYAVVLFVSLALTVFWTPHSLLADSLALSGVRRFGSSYPGMRIWGSLAFLAASFVGGMVLAVTSADAVPVMIAFGFSQRCWPLSSCRASAGRAVRCRCRQPSGRKRRRSFSAAISCSSWQAPASSTPATVSCSVSSRSTGRGSA